LDVHQGGGRSCHETPKKCSSCRGAPRRKSFWQGRINFNLKTGEKELTYPRETQGTKGQTLWFLWGKFHLINGGGGKTSGIYLELPKERKKSALVFH